MSGTSQCGSCTLCGKSCMILGNYVSCSAAVMSGCTSRRCHYHGNTIKLMCRLIHKIKLTFQQRVLPKDHPDLATSMNNLAMAYRDLGRHKEALKMQEETLAFQQLVFPESHPDIAISTHNLAASYGDLGRHAEALKLKEETLAFEQRMHPEDHPDVAASMRNVAITLFKLGRFADSEVLMKRALLIKFKLFGPKHPDVLQCRENLSALRQGLAAQGNGVAPLTGTGAAPRNTKSPKKVKPNERCPCGSGKKYKKCCMHTA